jgi:hypothetical protein
VTSQSNTVFFRVHGFLLSITGGKGASDRQEEFVLAMITRLVRVSVTHNSPNTSSCLVTQLLFPSSRPGQIETPILSPEITFLLAIRPLRKEEKLNSVQTQEEIYSELFSDTICVSSNSIPI